MVSLPAGLAAAVAHARGNPTCRAPHSPGRVPTCHRRRGSVDSDIEHAGPRVKLLSPKRTSFRGGTPEEALAWYLPRSMVEEPGVGLFL